jgi:hypothetical protein
MIETCQLSSGEEEEDCDDGVDGQKLYTFEPVRLTVAADLPGNDNGNRDCQYFGRLEDQVHRVRRNLVAGKHENRGDEQQLSGYSSRR